MLIESKIKIGPDNMFNIHQANFKSAQFLNKIALVQFQRNRTVGNPAKLVSQYHLLELSNEKHTGFMPLYDQNGKLLNISFGKFEF